MSKFKWLVVGASNIAKEFMIDSILANDFSDIECLVSKSPSLLESFNRNFNLNSMSNSLDDALKKKVNVAYVSGYNSTRFNTVQKCLEHGLHVLSEKPLTLTSREAEKLCSIAKKNKLILAVNHHLPCSSAHQKSKELLSTGIIGNLKSIRIFHSVELPALLREWRTNDNTSGGVLWDIGIHNIDLIRYLTNSPIMETKTIIEAQNNNSPETQSMSIFKLKTGVLVYCHEGYDTPYAPLGTQLVGTKGSIFTEESMTQMPVGKVYSITDSGRTDYEIKHQNLYQVSVNTFLNAIESQCTVISSGQDAINSIRIIEEIHKNLGR